MSGFVSDGARGGAVSQSLGTWNGPARPAALEGLTALELTGADRTGLLSEVFAVLADMECSVVEARAWTHRGRLACVAFLRGEDADAGRMPRILARLGHLLRGDPAEVPGPGRPRVPDAGRVRRRLGRARVLRGHRLRRVEAALGYGFLFVFFFLLQ